MFVILLNLVCEKITSLFNSISHNAVVRLACKQTNKKEIEKEKLIFLSET
jgi:hypothetical protein